MFFKIFICQVINLFFNCYMSGNQSCFFFLIYIFFLIIVICQVINHVFLLLLYVR